MKVIELYNKIINGGTEFEVSFYGKRKARLLNILYIIGIISAESYSILYAFIDFKTLYPSIINSNIYVLVSIFGMYLNSKNRQELSKHLFLSSLTLVSTITTYALFGTATHVHFYFLLFAVTPLLVWEIKQIKNVLIYFSINTFLFVYAHFLWVQPDTLIKFPTGYGNLLGIFTVIATFVSLLAALWINQSYIEYNETILERQSDDLKEMIDELHTQQEEIKRQAHRLDDFNVELEHTNKSLVELNATKDKFFSIIAHDLKNPISSLKGIADELRNKYDYFDEKDRLNFIEWISDSSNHVLSLLENLLEWSRIQRDQIKFNPEKLQLISIVGNLFGLMDIQARNKSIQLKTNVDEKLYVYADLNLLNTILRNLLSNAIKFSEDNGLIRLEAYDRGPYIEFSVADNGIGIPKDRIDKLFNIETTRSTPGTHNEKGTGLGLALCKEYVELHSGKIEVYSEEGKGTKFIFTIPNPNL